MEETTRYFGSRKETGRIKKIKSYKIREFYNLTSNFKKLCYGYATRNTCIDYYLYFVETNYPRNSLENYRYCFWMVRDVCLSIHFF